MNNPLLDSLNEAQRQIVLHKQGPALVIAGAGSGKTRVITHRVGQLLRNGVPANSILLLTFTNKAAEEMKHRVLHLAKAHVLTCTFHSLCARILRESTSVLGYGKDFLILDFDESGPVSIDIPPGTYNGTQLAEAVEVAARNAFGDDKKIQLTDGEDSFFSLDLKKTSGDGLSSGLATPIVVDLHADSYVITGALAKDGMTMDTFLQHAQVQINSSMNSYIQTGAAEGGDDKADKKD